MIDVNDIFNLFPNSGSKKEEVIEEVVDITSSPKYWLGMHKKLVLNHINFKKKALKFFKESNHELDIEDVKKAGEYVAYNKAWYYIKKINLSDKNHILDIIEYGDDLLETSLELAIQYFQDIEEYEKCAHLLKILKKSQEFHL